MYHDVVRGLSASIQVDDQDLDEHFDEENENSVYVEAVSGANFTIRTHFHSNFSWRYESLDIEALLDGQDVGRKLAYRGSEERIIRGALSQENGITSMQRFQFADLQTTDGAPGSSAENDLRDLGTIVVKLTWCKVVRRNKNNDFKINFKDVSESIAEKSLKGRAISTCTAMGARERVANRNFVGMEYPYGREPLAVFCFLYRSHRDLQIEGILQRTPSPVPLEERDPNTLNREELRQLLAKRDRELKTLGKIKKEKREHPTLAGGDDDDDDIFIISAGPSKRRRTSGDSAVEVVDLTDD